MFPMLADDELDDLAADIKANGQVYPIMLDADGVLIDGRNRLEACKRAKVEPVFDQLESTRDPVEYILSTNISRRHLNKGQRAMAVARAVLVSKTAARDGAQAASVSGGYVAKANTVLKYAGDLADSVMLGAMPLDEAYDEARDRKSSAEGTEAQMSKLRDEAPDLADLVAEERLTLPGAIGELRQREDDRKAAVRRDQDRLRSLVNGWSQLRALPEHPDRELVLAGLIDADRDVVLEIESIYLKGKTK